MEDTTSANGGSGFGDSGCGGDVSAPSEQANPDADTVPGLVEMTPATLADSEEDSVQILNGLNMSVDSWPHDAQPRSPFLDASPVRASVPPCDVDELDTHFGDEDLHTFFVSKFNSMLLSFSVPSSLKSLSQPLAQASLPTDVDKAVDDPFELFEGVSPIKPVATPCRNHQFLGPEADGWSESDLCAGIHPNESVATPSQVLHSEELKSASQKALSFETEAEALLEGMDATHDSGSVIPDIHDSRLPRPVPGEMRLSPDAMKARMRRLFEPNTKGQYKVSLEILKQYQSKGKSRHRLEQIFQSVGYCKDCL